MFIYSVSAPRLKIASLFLVFIICFVTMCLVIPGEGQDVVTSVPDFDLRIYENVKEAQDRVDFFKGFGWEVDKIPQKVSEVIIPSEFDAVYEKYNALQKAQGLDLKKYKGKSAKLYTYVVTNYDYKGTVYGNLLICNDRIIGGDICSANQNGFIHGFSKDNTVLF